MIGDEIMSDGPLERPHVAASSLGTGSVQDDVTVLLQAHVHVLPHVLASSSSVAAAIDLIVEGMSAGGGLIYVGAGTSGWLAALDAAEVVVTFGMTGRVDSIVGGGRTLDPIAMTLGDDAVNALADDEVMAGLRAGDLLLAVSASGQTPFTVAAARQARERGARVIAVVNAADTPLAQVAEVAIVVPIAGEVVAGSTRLTAGMAQKVVLNTLSTISMVRLGRTMGGQMVCVAPLNDKLRRRIVAAVATATGADVAAAEEVVAAAGSGDIATVALSAGIDVAEARARLEQFHGNIARAIAGRS